MIFLLHLLYVAVALVQVDLVVHLFLYDDTSNDVLYFCCRLF